MRERLAGATTGTRETAITYDTDGNVGSVTATGVGTTEFTYDSVGRMARVERPDTTAVEFAYDTSGNMTVLTVPTIVDHEFGYSLLNQNTSYFPPLSAPYSYTFDAAGRQTRVTYPSGRIVDCVYEDGRLSSIEAPETTTSFEYLSGNRLGSITRGTEIIAFGYDTSLLTSIGATGTLSQTLDFTYDTDLEVASIAYAGGTANYTYDDDGLVTGAGPFTIVRDAENGLPESVSDGTVTVTQTFNYYAEMSDFTTDVADTTVSLSVVRNDAGRITANTQTIDAVATVYAYTYDALGRLSTVTKDGDLDEEYEYDAQGRRTSEYNVSRGIVPARAYTYDAEDHLIDAGDFTYSYDADGFLSEKTTSNTPTLTTSYEYSSRGELESVTLPDTTQIDYVNDPLGRRIAKKVDGTTTEKYLWSGTTTLLAVYDNTNTLKARFLYALGRVPVAMEKDTQTYYLTYDQVGSLRAVLDTSGNIIKQIDYDSFGNILADTNPSFSIPFGFAGGLYDPDTGLVRFGARDYDPDTGRWTAKDPIQFAGGDPNLYGYVSQNPASLVDPSGKILPLIAAGVAVGALVNTLIYDLTTTIADTTWGGTVGAATAGGITGGVGVVAAPIGGALGLGTGIAGVVTVNAGAAVLAGSADAALDPNLDCTLGYLAASGAVGGLAGAGMSAVFPTRGMSSFGQVGFPRTWSGVVPRSLGGSAGQNATNGIFRGGTTAALVGGLGTRPFSSGPDSNGPRGSAPDGSAGGSPSRGKIAF